MNALAMYQNATADEASKAQAAIDSTANQVDPYRPEVAEKLDGKPTRKQVLSSTLYHFLFIGVFLFGAFSLLGVLTGELEISKG